MDIRQNKTVPPVRPQNVQNQDSASRSSVPRSRKKFQLNMPVVAAIIAVVILVIAATVLVPRFFGNVKADQYQAVFLTNGQVYFGKMSNPNSNFIKLNDVFYLQAGNTPQQADSEQSDAEQPGAQQTEPQLIKLGEELHGPEDEMFISSEQVLFWENLKNDGRVVEAIREFSTNN